MNFSLRALRVALSVALSVAVISCGGGGKGLSSSGSTTPTGSNVVSVIVDSGPSPTVQPSCQHVVYHRDNLRSGLDHSMRHHRSYPGRYRIVRIPGLVGGVADRVHLAAHQAR